MVIGNGLLANKFKEFKDQNFIFLTAGVSNSKCTDELEFNRENKTIDECIINYPNHTFVYFSTISIFSKSTEYTRHKIKIEELIKTCGEKYYIFRIPQVVGRGGNPNTIFNFIKNKMLQSNEIEVFDTVRSLLDLDDLFNIVSIVMSNYSSNRTYNVVGVDPKPVPEIIKDFNQAMGKRTKIIPVKTDEGKYSLNSREIDEVIETLNLNQKNYTLDLILKYLN